MDLLKSIQNPDDLRSLSIKQLPQVADEIRDYLIELASQNGGHFASNLGTVDLIVALHYAYNTPDDKLIWDVGHQAYAHKVLTERRDRMPTIRRMGGLCGFPKLTESRYDHLSVGHSSTSISAALGMAAARDVQGKSNDVVAVIGDGAMTGGLAFEGLNNLGGMGTRMSVVLNDNEMSISKSVGGLSSYLTKVISDKRYNQIKKEVWDLLGMLSGMGKTIRKTVKTIDDAVKHFIIPGKLFEDFGLRYFGPVDGHNIEEMVDLFQSIKESAKGPNLIHVITKKGKGYSYAEQNSTKYYAPGGFDRESGHIKSSSSKVASWSDFFAESIIDLAEVDEKIVAITAAMPGGTKLEKFEARFPDRFFDVGIAEQHAVTFSAGLALEGLIPCIGMYSTFLQRAFDQVTHDLALEKQKAIFGIDRGGLVGDDGETHQGNYDLSFLRSIPNVTLFAPRDEQMLRKMIYTAYKNVQGPSFVRYPRGSATGCEVDKEFHAIELSPEKLKQGTDIAILSVGTYDVHAAATAKILEEQGYSVALFDARVVKPLDATYYAKLFDQFSFVVTMEPGTICGGYGSAVLETCSDLNLESAPRIMRFGYDDAFITHGTIAQLEEQMGLTPEKMAEKILAAKPPKSK